MIFLKSSNILDFFKSGNIVVPMFFLKNYKKFNIEINEFIFLMYLYNLGNKYIFNPNKFCDDLGISLSDVMNYISVLTEKGLISVDVIKNEKGLMEEVVILDSFFSKITLLTISDINESNNNININSNIFELIEREFGRTLSSMEYEIIKAWLENNIKEEIIKEALKEATFSGVSNLRYIDKILYEWGKLGVKSVSDVEDIRKKRNLKKDEEIDIDMDIVDWNWFDDE